MKINGATSRVALVDRLESRRLLSAGAPDPSFGSDGVVSLPPFERLESRTLWSAAGTLDATFGANGVAPVEASPQGSQFSIQDIAVARDGKTLVAGGLGG